MLVVEFEPFAPGCTGRSAACIQPLITLPRTGPTAPALAPGVGCTGAERARHQAVRRSRIAGKVRRSSGAGPAERGPGALASPNEALQLTGAAGDWFVAPGQISTESFESCTFLTLQLNATR